MAQRVVPKLAFAKAQTVTVRAVFPHVCVLAEHAVFRGRRFGNFVLLGSHVELPVAALTRLTASDPSPDGSNTTTH